MKQAPAGWVRVVVTADGFVPRVAGYARFDDQPRWQSYDCGLARPGLGLPITTPKGDVELQMMKSASVRVTVDFTGKERPGGYIV